MLSVNIRNYKIKRRADGYKVSNFKPSAEMIQDAKVAEIR